MTSAQPAHGHDRDRPGPPRLPRRLPPPDVRRVDAGTTASRSGSSRRRRSSAPGSATRRPTCRTACATGLTESPLVPRAQTLELLGVMDDLRRQLGVRYAADAT